MIRALKEILLLSDESMLDYVIKQLTELGEYELTIDKLGEYPEYVFAVPKGDTCIPVILCSHVDTVRTQKDRPIVLREENGIILNENGILGGDDRCGVTMALAAAKELPVKPYLLFTDGEESGFTGMGKFIKNNPEVREFGKSIHAVISLDRDGYNDLVYNRVMGSEATMYMEYLTEKLGCVYGYSRGTDGCLLGNICNVNWFNMSGGFFNPHTAGEFVDIPAFYRSYKRLLILLNGEIIKHPFSTLVTYAVGGAHQSPKKTPTPEYGSIDRADVIDTTFSVDYPVCQICGKSHREVRYIPSVQQVICDICLTKLLCKAHSTLTEDSMKKLYEQVMRERTSSRIGNLHPNQRNNKPGDIKCPHCNMKFGVHQLSEDEKVCTVCGGKFWYDHSKRETIHTEEKDGQVFVIHIPNGNPSINPYKERFEDSKAIVKCHVCGKYVPSHATLELPNKKGCKVCRTCWASLNSSALYTSADDTPPWKPRPAPLPITNMNGFRRLIATPCSGEAKLQLKVPALPTEELTVLDRLCESSPDEELAQRTQSLADTVIKAEAMAVTIANRNSTLRKQIGRLLDLLALPA